MKIGLVSVDSKIPNLALMKLSAYHKAKGDAVEIYDPMFTTQIDRIYSSKVFNFTPEYGYYPRDAEIIKGGSGVDLQNQLSPEIESCYPDYELYGCEHAIGFTTRGCIRKCKFCIVPQKEGKVHEVGDIYDFWHGQKEMMLLDNNLTALPGKFEQTCKQLAKEKVKVDFSQGLDIRLIDADKARLLSKVKLWNQIHFAFDSVKSERAVRKGIKTLAENGVKPYKQMFYVLIGFDSTPEEDLYRVELLRSLKVDPFVMPFDKSNDYQRAFARWVNMKAVFKTTSWEDYHA